MELKDYPEDFKHGELDPGHLSLVLKFLDNVESLHSEACESSPFDPSDIGDSLRLVVRAWNDLVEHEKGLDEEE